MVPAPLCVALSDDEDGDFYVADDGQISREVLAAHFSPAVALAAVSIAISVVPAGSVDSVIPSPVPGHYVSGPTAVSWSLMNATAFAAQSHVAAKSAAAFVAQSVCATASVMDPPVEPVAPTRGAPSSSECPGFLRSISRRFLPSFFQYERALSTPVWEKSATSTVLCSTEVRACLLYTSPSPRDGLLSRMPSSA